MHQPEGYEQYSKLVCKFQKSIYGILKRSDDIRSHNNGQAQKSWNPTTIDKSNKNLYETIYVDDVLIIHDNLTAIQNNKLKQNEAFDI